ncbi:hypothetical protein IPN41_01995 [Candidatus Falkowbacteria bacterium]|nr:MAG: hypothetical protein IPN41_01995 [Candidatus Falkowbacteria bacterium]
MLNVKKWSILTVVLFTGMIYFSSCDLFQQSVPETKKETKPPATSRTNETQLGSHGVFLNGHIAMFGKDVVMDMESPTDTSLKYRPDLPVYAAAGDAGRGNGYMNSSAKSEWNKYKLNFDEAKQVWILDQPDKDKKPLMFTLCQVIESPNGATRIIWLQLERYESSGYVYDNRPGKNKRIAFCAEGYQPETIGGKEVPLVTTDGKFPTPDLQLTKVAGK